MTSSAVQDEAMAVYGSMHQVEPDLYISGYIAAANPTLLAAHGITRVLKMFADDPSYHGGAASLPGITYMVVAAEDRPDFNIAKHFLETLRFIRGGRAKNEKILVHCHAGVSRSATIVILCLMIERGLSLPAAYAALKRARPIVNPNSGFLRALSAVDSRLQRMRGTATRATAQIAGKVVKVDTHSIN